MVWFAGNGSNDRYLVSGTVQGWFGRRTVRREVTGRDAAKAEAARLRRRGAAKVQVAREGWWGSR